jgi:hypothetical protein
MRLPACAILLCALLAASLLTASGAWACDALVGDYAVAPNRPAMLRIEKAAGGFTARVKAEGGGWSAEATPTHDAAKDVASLARAECALSTPIGNLVKLKVGDSYRFNPDPRQDPNVYVAQTGFVLIIPGGFQQDPADLYRTARQGASPPPVAPPPLPAVGQEVTGAPACPGGKRPDMAQAAFDALPATERDRYRGQTAEWRGAFLCGQYLSDLMTTEPDRDPKPEADKADKDKRGKDKPKPEKPKADRKETLAEITRLIGAGQAPRTPDGSQDWWAAAGGFLETNRPTDPKVPVPLRDEGYDLFEKVLIPHLPYPSAEDLSGYPSEVEKFVAETAHLPEAQALFTLAFLDKMGVLTMKPTPDADIIAARMLWAVLAQDVSDKAFARIAAAAGPAVRDPDLLRREIDDGNLIGVRRLLALGADPTPADMLVRARDGGSPQMYELISKAVAAYKPPKAK